MNDTHYEIDGVSYPRVSTILSILSKPGLDQWRRWVGFAQADRVSKEAADRGTMIHAACDEINRGTHLAFGLDDFLDGLSEQLRPFVRGYAAWFERDVKQVTASELQVVHNRLGYAGTMDLWAVLRDGTTAVLDLKTSKRVWPEYALQLAAYRLALQDNGLDATRRIVIHLPKTKPGQVVLHEYPDHAGDTRAWIAALLLWRWRAKEPMPTKEGVYAHAN